MRLALLAAALTCAGCTLITNFDPSRTAEVTDKLCADGLDNDGDGLRDCQDWDCLSRKPCCTLEALVFQDSFDATASSSGCVPIDPALWQVWGQPLPVACNGVLKPNKAEQCYDVGVLGVSSLAMHPGLVVTAHVRGRPEQAGRMVIGFTMQDKIAGGATVCEPITPVSTFAEARVVRSPAGIQMVARFEGRDLATSAELDGDQAHEIRLAIGADRKLTFSIDQKEVASSDPLPVSPVRAHLALLGRGQVAGVEDVRVTDGTQCESPAAWQPATRFEALAGVNDNGGSWDSFQVLSPAISTTSDGPSLLYGGCSMGTASNRCSTGVGFGRAIELPDGTLMRDPVNPIHFDVSRNNVDVGTVHEPQTQALTRGYLTSADVVSNFSLYLQTFTLGGPGTAIDLGAIPLFLGEPGQFDDGAICCAAAVRHDGQVSLWYAGQRKDDPTWRIGLATSPDGITFQRYLGNPVMIEGGRDDYDGRGVTEPEVLWDQARGLFRMWYTADGFLGTTSIAYAVSTDGILWHKFPGNPVVPHAAVGLDVIGSAAVRPDINGLKMWVHGAQNGRVGMRIFALENRGAPSSDTP